MEQQYTSSTMDILQRLRAGGNPQEDSHLLGSSLPDEPSSLSHYHMPLTRKRSRSFDQHSISSHQRHTEDSATFQRRRSSMKAMLEAAKGDPQQQTKKQGKPDGVVLSLPANNGVFPSDDAASSSPTRPTVSPRTALRTFTVYLGDGHKRTIVYQPEAVLKEVLGKTLELRQLSDENRICRTLNGKTIDIEAKLKDLKVFEISYLPKTEILRQKPKPLPKKTATTTVLKSGLLLVNGCDRFSLCQLLDSNLFVYYADETKTKQVDSIDMRWKYVNVDESILIKNESGIFSIVTETNIELVRLMASTYDDMIEWIQLLEGISVGFLNKAPSNIHLKGDWLHHRIQLWIGTWNVGNSVPPDDLSLWLPVNANFDLVVVGVQECTYKSYLDNNSSDWYDRVKSAMGSRYTIVSQQSLWEIRIVILVKATQAQHISELKANSVATGIANVAGNKGGIGVGFRFHNTSMCFLNSHLAAHQEMVAQRNQDAKEIIRRMRLSAYQSQRLKKQSDFPNYYTHTFWLGDLNYRLALPYDTVYETCNDGHEMSLLFTLVSLLADADQLRNERIRENCFIGFHEMETSFWPTYRYFRQQRDSHGRRVFNPEKLRVPSWCDRVLWRSHSPKNVVARTYNSAPDVDTSDHVPVYFEASLDTVISPKLLSSCLSGKLNQVTGILHFKDLKAIGIKWKLQKDTAVPSKSKKQSRKTIEDRTKRKMKSVLVSKPKKSQESDKKYERKTLNPYLSFRAPFFPSHRSNTTQVVVNSDTPVWGDYDLFVLGVPSVPYFETQHVVLEILNNIGSSKSAPLGQAVIPLSGTTGEHPQRFNEPVLLHGELVAYIAGSVLLNQSDENQTFNNVA